MMRDANNGHDHLAVDVERRPARSPADATWARDRFARVRRIWEHAAASYGPDWAAQLHVLFSEGAPILAHPAGDTPELEALRRWVATDGGARG